MTRLVYYNPYAVVNKFDKDFPGMDRFSQFFKIYNMRMMLSDRTDTIDLPIRTKTLFPLPKFKRTNETLEEICDRRALELLERAEKCGVRIYVLWSGGVDSTLVLVSLLKNATNAQKNSLIVLLSEESITEYPYFYENHIRGRLNMEPTAIFPFVLGTKDIVTNGELGDQIFGSPFSTQALMRMFGNSIIHEPYKKNILFEFYNAKTKDKEVTDFYLSLFNKLMLAAPVKITTYFDYFWWLLFVLEWQACFMRILQFTREENIKNITQEYISTNLAPFFGTEDFQMWSMNNLDKRIKDTSWDSYKWPSKDIIYNFTKDLNYYEQKGKEPSVSIWRQRTNQYNFIDESMKLHHELDTEKYYNSRNSFA